jgi:hypothetical protein
MKKLVIFCFLVAMGLLAILAILFEVLVEEQQSMAREREIGTL